MICNSLTLLPGKSVQRVASPRALSCHAVRFVLANDVSTALPTNFSMAFLQVRCAESSLPGPSHRFWSLGRFVKVNQVSSLKEHGSSLGVSSKWPSLAARCAFQDESVVPCGWV